MVFVVLTRFGFDQIESRVVHARDAVWVNAGVLSESEAIRLRASGWDLTAWTNPLNPDDLESDIDMVRLHHRDHVIWVEAAAGQAQGS